MNFLRKAIPRLHFVDIMTSVTGQKKISRFFQPLSQKRENVNAADNENVPLKKTKLASTADGQENIPDIPANSPQKDAKSPKKIPESPPKMATKSPVASTSFAFPETIPTPESLATPPKSEKSSVPDSSPSAALSPEQKERMDANKLQAEMKLMTKTTHGVVVNVGPTWFKALKSEFEKPYFVKLAEFVSQERHKGKVFPPADQVFTWTKMCNIRQVKAVIIGQDPYHDVGQAHGRSHDAADYVVGLCFSVQKGIRPPPSLVNMYKELEKDIDGFKHPGHGDLTGWAEQGVLLLNACLTVRAHNANSHSGKGWEKVTDATISWINKNNSGVVFLLWGAYAQKKCAHIDKKRHHILKAVHPSPLSAHRGFFGCKHFSQCNDLLKKEGKKPIDWCHLPAKS